VYHLQEDSKAPAASHGEKDTFTASCFPGLKISAAKVFKR